MDYKSRATSKGFGFGSFLLVVLVLLLAVLWFIPAPAIKWGIETYGSEHVGAKVEVEGVSFSWLSAGLAIEGLQVTDPSAPMENMLVIDRIATALDVAQLLDKKLYFDELAIEGVGVGEARAESGALSAHAAIPADESSGFSLASLGLPSSDELVAQEKAIYEDKINAYKDNLASKQKSIEDAIKALPDKDALNAYKARIKKAKDSAKGPLGKFAALKEFKRIQKDVKKDVKKVREVQKLIKDTLADLKKDYELLKDLPNQSASEIVKSLGLEKSMAANAGQTLLAGRFDSWVKQALGYYNAVAGGNDRLSGDAPDTARGSEKRIKTSPDFLIKKVLLSGALRQGGREGEMSGEVINLSEAPSLFPEPITVNLKAAGVAFGKLALNGVVDHRKMGAEEDTITLSVTDSTLENYPLTEQSGMALLLKKALLSIQVNASVKALSTLDMAINAGFSNIDLAVSSGDAGRGGSDVQQAVIEALKETKDIQLQGKAVGPLDKLTLSLKSNLDDVLGGAVSQVVKNKVNALKGDVSKKLEEELSLIHI
ncbi:MAG: TIGR03545 family protein [Pseudomonadales bacterium]|nr:TIGR03545 family protein [Pseudomonadales bacterium]